MKWLLFIKFIPLRSKRSQVKKWSFINFIFHLLRKHLNEILSRIICLNWWFQQFPSTVHGRNEMNMLTSWYLELRVKASLHSNFLGFSPVGWCCWWSRMVAGGLALLSHSCNNHITDSHIHVSCCFFLF